ncbi:hypothetical protein OZ410_08690 [Robiginitalea sp. M366]|uniref:hypothetical protein n=1 Tax=Robiginitalea aestuariiviva TaxID=3036903 RepID=UPI00240CF71A|nr:hypothetical protein [Robiginitalea aestuariiviva]MDG1572391.1 hypothetical protein [Robiginitalea aestuariiviva]
MKAILTFVFIIFLGFFVQAQERPAQVKVEALQMEMVQVAQIQQNMAMDKQVARLYRRSGSRVKKALSFATLKDRGVA